MRAAGRPADRGRRDRQPGKAHESADRRLPEADRAIGSGGGDDRRPVVLPRSNRQIADRRRVIVERANRLAAGRIEHANRLIDAGREHEIVGRQPRDRQDRRRMRPQCSRHTPCAVSRSSPAEIRTALSAPATASCVPSAFQATSYATSSPAGSVDLQLCPPAISHNSTAPRSPGEPPAMASRSPRGENARSWTCSSFVGSVRTLASAPAARRICTPACEPATTCEPSGVTARATIGGASRRNQKAGRRGRHGVHTGYRVLVPSTGT